MFTYQLVVDGQIVGDSEPTIIGSEMGALQDRPSFSFHQLPDARSNPSSTVELLLAQTDDQLDSAMLRGETLDRWLVWMYIQQSHAVVLAQASYANCRIGPILMSIVSLTDFQLVIDAAVRYWRGAQGRPTAED
jgi:hypothetical protein